MGLTNLMDFDERKAVPQGVAESMFQKLVTRAKGIKSTR